MENKTDIKFLVNNSAFLIIDLQKDFASRDGSLSVNDGTDAKNIKNFLHDYGSFFKAIITTQDMHPKNHCSFIENNGRFPTHCVQDTIGSELFLIHPELVYHGWKSYFKGTDPSKDEFSFLDDKNNRNDFIKYIFENGITEIVVCGEALDFCVCSTILDLADIYIIRKIVLLSDLTSPAIETNKQGVLQTLKFVKKVEVMSLDEFINLRTININDSDYLETKMKFEEAKNDILFLLDKFNELINTSIIVYDDKKFMRAAKNLFLKSETLEKNDLKFGSFFSNLRGYRSLAIRNAFSESNNNQDFATKLNENYMKINQTLNSIVGNLEELLNKLRETKENAYYKICNMLCDPDIPDNCKHDMAKKILSTIPKHQTNRYYFAIKKFSNKISEINKFMSFKTKK